MQNILPHNAVEIYSRERGVLAGYPLVNVRVELVHGSYHEVDSNAMTFEIAGNDGLREAAKKPNR